MTRKVVGTLRVPFTTIDRQHSREFILFSCATAHGVCLLLLAFAAGCESPSMGQTQLNTTPVAAKGESLEASLYPVTLANCASSGCHGGSPPKGGAPPTWANAATVWQSSDPHRHAFVVLYSERGINMVKRLEGWDKEENADKCTDAAFLVVLENRCTGCHAVHESNSPASKAEQYVLGVTCTGCHGEASHWGHAHYQGDWRDEDGKLIARKEFTEGFHDLRDLSSRAEACLQCHIGPGQGMNGQKHDMNHDLIAAGHPRLDFEFSAYLSNLPPHWDTSIDEQRASPAAIGSPGTFNFDAWLAGQTAATSQRELLEAFRKNDGKAPWPEFSAFDCFKCHHTYASALFPTADKPWDNWRQSNPALQTSAAPKDLLPQLAALLPTSNEPLPLNDRIAHKRLIVKLFPAEVPRSFEQAVQAQLALDAWLADQPPKIDPRTELRAAADDLRKILQSCFPTKNAANLYDAPSDFAPTKEELAAAWQAVRTRLTE